jgi:hypothetical protein
MPTPALFPTTAAVIRANDAGLPLRQLMGRHGRLARELSAARIMQPQYAGRINRLAADLAAAEREISQMLSAERPTSDEDLLQAA